MELRESKSPQVHVSQRRGPHANLRHDYDVSTSCNTQEVSTSFDEEVLESYKRKFARSKKRTQKLQSKVLELEKYAAESRGHMNQKITEMACDVEVVENKVEECMRAGASIMEHMDMNRQEEDREQSRMLCTITDMCEENMQLRGDMDQLLRENTQLRIDIDSLRDEMCKMHITTESQMENTQLHDDELQRVNAQLRCDVDELQDQVRLRDTAMASYMQLVARVENTMQEKEDNMNMQAMELQSRMVALENGKLRRTVSSTMDEMQHKADERFVKLMDIANVFYKYIMGNITNSSVKRRLEKKGYLDTTTEPPDITPTNSQPTSPNTARFPS